MNTPFELSPGDHQLAAEFAAGIDIEDPVRVLNYGAATRKKIAELSDSVLQTIRHQDSSSTDQQIEDTLRQLRELNLTRPRGVLGWFRRELSLPAMQNRYKKALTCIDTMSRSLQQHQIRLMKDAAILEKMYEQNLKYGRELSIYIAAGRMRLQEVRSGKLLTAAPALAQILTEKCHRFERKLHDLEITRVISLQTGPQIRLIQSSSTAAAEKIQTILFHTIPLWKNQMALALGMAHATEAVRTHRKAANATGALLRQSNETLRQSASEASREAQKGAVDLETLKQTNADLIRTLDEVAKIQADGRARRMAAEAEIRKIEQQLQTASLSAGTP